LAKALHATRPQPGNNLSLSGGSQNTTYYITGGFLDIQGIMKGDDYRRSQIVSMLIQK